MKIIERTPACENNDILCSFLINKQLVSPNLDMISDDRF